MGQFYKIDKVLSRKDDKNQHGPIVYWRVLATDEEGEQQPYEISSKPEGNKYQEGDEFYAEKEDTRFGPKLRRKQPPDNTPSRTSGANGTAQVSYHSALSYTEAVDLYHKIAKDLNYDGPTPHEWVTSVLIAIQRGAVGKPDKVEMVRGGIKSPSPDPAEPPEDIPWPDEER